MQILYPGSSVDQLAILLGIPYPYSAVTLSDATLLRLRLDTIRALEELFPEIAFRWLGCWPTRSTVPTSGFWNWPAGQPLSKSVISSCMSRRSATSRRSK
jgi:CRP-like cAMP-binding protein